MNDVDFPVTDVTDVTDVFDVKSRGGLLVVGRLLAGRACGVTGQATTHVRRTSSLSKGWDSRNSPMPSVARRTHRLSISGSAPSSVSASSASKCRVRSSGRESRMSRMVRSGCAAAATPDRRGTPPGAVVVFVPFAARAVSCQVKGTGLLYGQGLDAKVL